MKDKNVKYCLEYCKSSILAIIISADSQFPHVEQERVRGGV